MKDDILSNLENPRQLEGLYRADRATFKRVFDSLYPQIKDHPLVGFWHERLNYAREEVTWGSSKDIIFVLAASLLAGFNAKIPAVFDISEEFFFPRNAGFIIFPVLALYFTWKNHLSVGKASFIAGSMVLGLIFINSLPDHENSSTLVLSCIHLLLFLWSVLGFAFVGKPKNEVEKRLDFLKYNGDLLVMTTLMLIAGGIMTAVTIGLFSLIGFEIENFYFEYVAIFGLAAAPVVGTYLTQTNPSLVGRVSPVIARIFSPLVLVMLVIYLVAMLYAGKDPYNDREFLIIFNVLLIGVMAIIFFSVAEASTSSRSIVEITLLFLLSLVTIIVNGIALSAIVFRIAEWGITPNRAAVLGGNLLILINLLLVSFQLFKAVTKKADIKGVGSVIALYLPLYFIWTIVVTFLFPLIFSFE